MFQFPGFAHRSNLRCGGIAPAGFPHSDIRGSQGICPSPRLFAACHVLLRLREPQASPVRPCSLSLSLRLATTNRRSRLMAAADLFAYIRLARFFRFSQLNRLILSSFCVPTMSMISFEEEIAELNRYPSRHLWSSCRDALSAEPHLWTLMTVAATSALSLRPCKNDSVSTVHTASR